MEEFSYLPVDFVNNPLFKFYKVMVKGKSPFDEFVGQLTQKKDLDNFASIVALMDMFSNRPLPKTMFNHIIGDGRDRNDIYEFKKNNLRVYVMLQKPNVFLLLGGFKTGQKQDVKRLFKLYNTLPNTIRL